MTRVLASRRGVAAPHRSVARVLERATDRLQLDADDVVLLLEADGTDLLMVQQRAQDLRDEGLRLAARPGVLTYSRGAVPTTWAALCSTAECFPARVSNTAYNSVLTMPALS